MTITAELRRFLEALPADFYGNVEISVQAGIPGTARTLQSHKLTPSRDTRGGEQNATRGN